MIYALIGFIGVILGVICTCVCMLLVSVEEESVCDALPSQTEADEDLAKQWQNLLNFTADAGGDQDAER